MVPLSPEKGNRIDPASPKDRVRYAKETASEPCLLGTRLTVRNPASASLCCPGQADPPQAQRSERQAGSLRRHPEAVQLSGADPGPGAPEAAQCPLPHAGPTQCPRLQVKRSERATCRAVSNVVITFPAPPTRPFLTAVSR